MFIAKQIQEKPLALEVKLSTLYHVRYMEYFAFQTCWKMGCYSSTGEELRNSWKCLRDRESSSFHSGQEHGFVDRRERANLQVTFHLCYTFKGQESPRQFPSTQKAWIELVFWGLSQTLGIAKAGSSYPSVVPPNRLVGRGLPTCSAHPGTDILSVMNPIN